MPIYEYKCEDCRKTFEKLQKVSDPPCKKCPNCGGRLKKLISTPAIQFKGDGFYITDYAKKSGPSEDKSAGKPAGSAAKAAKESKETKGKAETIPSDTSCSD
jgi:putative FmdB family regulatory protein